MRSARNPIAMAALISALGMRLAPAAPVERPEPAPKPKRTTPPRDLGPIIDTTPESKRARRRRLAREGGRHG